MRALTLVALGVASMAAGAALTACVDLFHSTAGILDVCELDAAACADGGADLCAVDAGPARQIASRACAWLGACESPLGHNAFGACMVDAVQALDCTVSPGHPARGGTLALWECLAAAQACADVDRCVFPGGVPVCGSAGDFTSCGDVGGVAANAAVRIECTDGGAAHGESCALRGETCATQGTTGTCAGATADGGGLACQTSGCDGTRLHWCADGGDIGLDCASTGARRCAGFPSTGPAQWVACVPQGDAGCAPDASASCSGGVATSCPAGVLETVDCAGLLQAGESSCNAGPLAAPFDWTSACTVVPPSCDTDSCSGTTLQGCARGAIFNVDCAQVGLGACQMATTGGGGTHAACTPP